MKKSGRSTIVVAGNLLANSRSVSFRASDVRRIAMRLYGGNDTGTVDRSVTIPAIVDGGAGNDTLRGGAAPAVLLGGDGKDDLAAGLGRSILIGGNGSDKLKGSNADDILIGGSAAHDANEAALLAAAMLSASAGSMIATLPAPTFSGGASAYPPPLQGDASPAPRLRALS